MSVDVVHSFRGDAVAVMFDRSEFRQRQGIFGSNRDVQVVKGQQYVAVTSSAQKVCGVATTATPAPLPTDAIKTTDH